MEDVNNPALAPPRQPLKSNSHVNNYVIWKTKLRENCYKRVREDRSRLLWKMRLPAVKSTNHKEFIKSALQDIVSDELKKLKDPSSDAKKPSSVPEVNDILWEYDGLHSACQGECEEMLLEMQRIFYEDLRAEPARKDSEDPVETLEDQEDEYLARAVYEHMQLNDDVHSRTWCPICKKGELQENHQLIYCNLCKLQLSKDDELNLDILRVRLADAHTEHLDHGCRLKPKFCMESKFGLTALYIVCEGCDTFEIVM